MILDFLKSKNKVRGGMALVPPDERDFLLGDLGIKPKPLHDNDFIVGELEILDQKKSSFCVGYGTCLTKQKQEKEKLSPTGLYAMMKKLIDKNISWGSRLDSGMKCLVKYGCPEQYDFPYDASKSRSFILNPKHIPVLKVSAKDHKSRTYFQVYPMPGMTPFNAIRSAMITYDERVNTGIRWNRAYDKLFTDHSGILPNPTGAWAFGHDIVAVGQKTINNTLYLALANSYGTRFGDNGLFYMTEQQVNRYLNYGGLISLDIERDLAELLLLYNGKAVKSKDNKDVYIIKDGKKCYIPSVEVGWCWGIRFWDSVIVITKNELELIPTGKPVTDKEGHLYKLVTEVLNSQK